MSPAARAPLAAAALAALIAAAYLVVGPPSKDLAAATFRADLFAEHGFLVWNNDWYSGHYLLSYSVLFPPLGALLGPRLLAALAAIAAAALFARLAERRFGERALIPSLWFAAAVAAWLFTGRVPFLLAVPLGLGSLLALDHGRLVLAAILALLTTLASPVAGLFLGVAAAAIALAGRWREGVVVALAAAIPMLALNLAFPVGGEQPFVFSAFFAVPLLAGAVLWLVPAEYRVLRIGVALYALLALLVFLVPNPLGGNVTRLGALLAGPVLALVLWPRGRWVLLAVSLPLLYWQLVAPVRDVGNAAGDRSTEVGFYSSLLDELRRLAPPGSVRLHIPPTRNRWEAAYVAPEYPIARGWLRQLEHEDFDRFTGGELTADAYRSWLDDAAVTYVAVPDASRDYLAEDEVDLIDEGLPYLEPVWESADWRLFQVAGVERTDLPGRDVKIAGPDSFEVAAAAGGAFPTAINWSRYWRVSAGDACLQRDERDDSTTVVANEAGRIVVEQDVGLGGADRCSA